MKSLMLLWNVIAEDLAISFRISTVRDCKTVSDRVRTEGLSFLTITLPEFGKAFEQALSRSQVTPDTFAGFKGNRAGLPHFLGGFLCRVFDSTTGTLLESPCHFSIFAVRQLTLLFGKISLDCSLERQVGAVAGYLETEKEVEKSSAAFAAGSDDLRSDYSEFRRMSRLLYGELISKLDEEVYYNRLTPKHGPGATADRLRGNAKFDQYEWPNRLEEYFPYGEYAIASWRYHYRLDDVHFLEPKDERPVRVILVPKTLKTPRIIAIEPTAMQYMQQGLMERFVECLENDSVLQHLIGFSSQLPNQELAEKGSRTGCLATLDLSEASDRVSIEHVRALFHDAPNLLGGVEATRSQKALVPGLGVRPDRVISLAKFASMGSALTFPIEAMTFLTVICLALEAYYAPSTHRLLSSSDIRKMVGEVRVYGDDIIVPTQTANLVSDYLARYGFKVNVNKSFWKGKFRESCGKEYYDGTDVSISRVREVLPTRLADVSEIISTVSLRNQLYLAGLWKATRYLDELLEGVLKHHYPLVSSESPVLGRVSFLGYETQKICPNLHRPLVKGYVVKSDPPTSMVSGEGALLKWFLKRGQEPFADRDHLERSGRPKSVKLRLRYGQPF